MKCSSENRKKLISNKEAIRIQEKKGLPERAATEKTQDECYAWRATNSQQR